MAMYLADRTCWATVKDPEKRAFWSDVFFGLMMASVGALIAVALC